MVTATRNSNKSSSRSSTMAKTSSARSKSRSAKAPTPESKAAAELLKQNTTLQTAVAQIEKQFGEGAIMPLGVDKRGPIEGISTGCLSLDMALGGRGIPRGRIIECFGPESSGKTTLALHVVAQAQRKGGIAAFIDAEHALDPTWAKKLGVELETLLVSQPVFRRRGDADHRDAGQVQRGGHHRGRLGRGPGSQGGTRRRDWRFACRPAGPLDEPVDAEADRVRSTRAKLRSSSSTRFARRSV